MYPAHRRPFEASSNASQSPPDRPSRSAPRSRPAPTSRRTRRHRPKGHAARRRPALRTWMGSPTTSPILPPQSGLAADRVSARRAKFERLRAFHFFPRLQRRRDLGDRPPVSNGQPPRRHRRHAKGRARQLFLRSPTARLRVSKQGPTQYPRPRRLLRRMALCSPGRGARASSVESVSEACILCRAPSLLRLGVPDALLRSWQGPRRGVGGNSYIASVRPPLARRGISVWHKPSRTPSPNPGYI